MTIDLSGKVAVVTGATGNLGRTMVRSLAECGANVAICYYGKKEFALELQKEIEDQYGVKGFPVKVDVTSLSSVLEMKRSINDNLGVVDIIITNAVIQLEEWKSILDQEIEAYKSQFESSVMQNVNMAKAFVPAMKEQKYGRVIGINTECIEQSFPTQSAYISGKKGMDGVLRVLANEVGPFNITVNQIAPGWTISDRCRNPDGTEKQINQDFTYIDRVPMRRRGSDKEIANVVCFLASDLASFISGVYLPVCGGNVMP